MKIVKTRKKGLFQTNGLSLHLFPNVFAIDPHLSKLEIRGFSYVKQEKELENLHFLRQRSSLVPGDFSQCDLKNDINDFEILLQDPGTEVTGSALLRPTIHQAPKRLPLDP